MTYTINKNAVNVWARDHDDTMDLSIQTDASSVYLDNGRTLEHELGNGSMVSNIATVDSGMERVIDGTYDGAYETCQMYGKSLVNLVNGHSSLEDTNSVHTTFSEGVYTFSAKEGYDGGIAPSYMITLDMIQKFTVGKTYTMVLTSLDMNDCKFAVTTRKADWSGIITYSEPSSSANYTRKFKFTPTSEDYMHVQLRLMSCNSSVRSVRFKNVMILEGDWTDKELPPYFTGLCDVKAPILKNVGKNLFDMTKVETDTLTVRFWDTTITRNTIKSVRKGDNVAGQFGAFLPLKVKPSTTYTIQRESYKNNQRVINGIAMYVYHNSSIWGYSLTSSMQDSFSFTTLPDTDHIAIGVNYGAYEIGTILETKNIQLEEANVSTLYEDYKTNILTTPEQVVLRKVGDVCDSYDALTGEYIQRIGEVVYNNTNVTGFYVSDSYQKEGCTTFMRPVDETFKKESKMISNLLPFSPIGHWNDVDECLFAGTVLVIRLKSTKASNVTELREYLSQYPLTVQYELATPITTTIEPSTIPFVYENGHIMLESGYEGQSLLPTLEYSTVINRTGQVQSIANTVQKQEKQITKLEQMLIQNIVDLDYNNTLLTLGLEINEVI